MLNELDQELKELSKNTGSVCVGFNLRKASRLVMRLYDQALKPIHLNGTQFSLLLTVAAHRNATIGELAKPLCMERSTLSRNLIVLQKKNWVQLETGEDRRQQRISITLKGVATLREALPLWQKVQDDLTNELGEEKTSNLLTYLGCLVKNNSMKV